MPDVSGKAVRSVGPICGAVPSCQPARLSERDRRCFRFATTSLESAWCTDDAFISPAELQSCQFRQGWQLRPAASQQSSVMVRSRSSVRRESRTGQLWVLYGRHSLEACLSDSLGQTGQRCDTESVDPRPCCCCGAGIGTARTWWRGRPPQQHLAVLRGLLATTSANRVLHPSEARVPRLHAVVSAWFKSISDKFEAFWRSWISSIIWGTW
jgi:hypothetical protein